MKRRIICLSLVLGCLLSGCSWTEGSYHNITPHRVQYQSAQTEAVSAVNYRQLCAALEEMIDGGTQSSVVNVSGYDQTVLEQDMEKAAHYATSEYPIGAYAVEKVTYETGANSGKPAIAINITYRHNRTEIQKIRHVQNVEKAEAYLQKALADCDSGIVFLIDNYVPVDFAQLVEDYAALNPQTVMEIPQVSAGVYPEGTGERVVELTFTYYTSRDTLRQMQKQVESVFDSAALYVSGDAEDGRKLTQLYAFLMMENFEYQLETSITPAYSLLRHGVGDSRAFATVYAAMCRRAGLECRIVIGTRSGEPWCWNIVKDGENYFHVDLVRCSDEGGFREYSDPDMQGYVWDYSAYPECPQIIVPQPEEALPTEETTEPEEETGATEEPVIPTETEASEAPEEG